MKIPAAMRKAPCLQQILETPPVVCTGQPNKPERAAARAILTKLRAGEPRRFTARTYIDMIGRSHCREQVREGLDLLVELHHLAASSVSTFRRGGRPTTTYTANPRGLA